jgi:hypothetical protein
MGLLVSGVLLFECVDGTLIVWWVVWRHVFEPEDRIARFEKYKNSAFFYFFCNYLLLILLL